MGNMVLPQITVTPRPLDNTPIDILPQGYSTMTPEQASDLAAKTKFALPGLPQTEDDLNTAYSSGQERDVRQQAALYVDGLNNKAVQEGVVEAINRNPNLSSEEVQQLTNQFPPANPDTVIEQAYGKSYLSSATKENDFSGSIGYARLLNPAYFDKLTDAGSEILAQRQIAARVLQNAVEKYYKPQSWGGWMVDQAKSAVPFYRDVKLRGLVNDQFGQGFGTNLVGSALEEEITRLAVLPLPQYKQRLEELVDQLAKDNPTLAVQFAEAAMGRAASDVNIDNAFNFLDFASIPAVGLTKTAKSAANAAKMRKLVKDAIKSIDSPEPPKVAAAQGAGDLETAAVQKVVDNAINPNPEKQPLDEMFSYLRSDKEAAAARPSRVYRELYTRLGQQWDGFVNDLKTALERMSRVDRLGAFFKLEQNLINLKESLKGQFPGLSNTILDINVEKAPLGTGYNAVFRLGTKNGVMFDSEETAHGFALLNNLDNFKIKESSIKVEVRGEGGGHYIEISKPLRETDDVIRDGLLVREAQTPEIKNLAKYFSSYRTGDEIFSKQQTIQRKTAVYSANILNKIAKDTGKYLEDLDKGKIRLDPVTGEKISRFNNRRLQLLGNIGRAQRIDQFNRVLEASKDLWNVRTKKPGYWFKSPGELEDFYQQMFKRPPDDVEIEAYFAAVRLTEMDRVLRNLEAVTMKHRLGVETHTVHVNGVESPQFDGVLLRALPTGSEEHFLLVRNGRVTKGMMGRMAPRTAKALREGVDSGKLKVVRMFDPDQHELSGFKNVGAERRFVYVVTDNVKTKPISWEQVPRQEGGHFIYDYDHWLKQANVVKESLGANNYRWTYLGDNTIMPVRIRKMGQDVAEKLDFIRERLRHDDIQAAKDYHRTSGLPMNWDELYSWFLPTRNPETGKVMPPKLNVNERIQVVSKNRAIADTQAELQNKYGRSFKDGTTSGSLAKQYQIEFTGERDAQNVRTIVNKGTRDKPLYELEDAEKLDPIPSITRSLNRIINTSLMDDYKIFSAEHWLQEALTKEGGILNVNIDQVRAAPFFHFLHADYLPGIDEATKAVFEAQRYQIKQLWGTPSTYQRRIQNFNQKLIDSIYGTFGDHKALAVAEWSLPLLDDPLSFLRSAAFNFKIGLFGPKQFIVQNMTYGQIYAIAPQHAPAGTAAALMKQWTRLNKSPATIDKMDEMLSKMGFGWKPGQFREAMDLLDRSGFEHVFGEYAMIDNSLSTKFIRNGFDRFLDWGQFPFREGEKSARFGAWFTAYKEYRNLHPHGKISEGDLKEILNRADLMVGNMSRASSSALHTGVMSFSAQFLAYQLRITEQLIGKRLTPAEKARVVFFNWGLYGLPAMTGLSGIPMVGDYIKKKALQGEAPGGLFTFSPYVVGDNFVADLFMNGLPASAIGFITGTYPNFGERYGNSGFSILSDIFGETTGTDNVIWKAIGGAPGSVLSNTIARSNPFLQSMLAMLRGDAAKFPATENDFVDILKEISSVKDAWRYLTLLHTGRWLSANETYLSDVSPLKGLLFTLTGLEDQRVADARVLRRMVHDQEELEKHVIKQAGREYKRYLQALNDDDFKQADQYAARTKFYMEIGGLSPTRQRDVIGKLKNNDENQALIRTAPWNAYINPKNVPEGRAEVYQDTFGKIQNQIEGK